MIKKKYILLCIAGIILVPMLVNVLMMIPTPFTVGDYTNWIPFFGGMYGSLIAGAITFYVLSKTIKHNKDTSNKAIKESRKALLLNYKSGELNLLRSELANNLEVFNVSVIYRALTEKDESSIDSLLRIAGNKAHNQKAKSILYFNTELDTINGRIYTLRLNKVSSRFIILIHNSLLIFVLNWILHRRDYSDSEMRIAIKSQVDNYNEFIKVRCLNKRYKHGYEKYSVIKYMSKFDEKDLIDKVHIKAVNDVYIASIKTSISGIITDWTNLSQASNILIDEKKQEIANLIEK